MTAAPELMTERLRMRGHVPEDFEAYAAMWGSERSRFMDGPISRKQAWDKFSCDVAMWTFFGFGAWALERTGDGVVIGQVAIQQPDYFPEVELGWVLYDGFEGHGYAFEAATTAKSWGFGARGLPTLVSYVDAANDRSRRLCERLGGALDEAAQKTDPADVVYRYLPEAA